MLRIQTDNKHYVNFGPNLLKLLSVKMLVSNKNCPNTRYCGHRYARG